MTNQEAIEIIKTAIAQVEWDYPMDYAAAFDMAIKALENGWISVKERLPDARGQFLVVAIEARKYIHITLSEFSKYFIMTGRRSYWKVTHWMPLPEPPKEET